MMLEISFFRIFLAGVVSMCAGFLWYHPKVFGVPWMRMSHISPSQVERAKALMPLMAFFGLLTSMMMAWALSYIAIAFSIFGIMSALKSLAFFVWLGVVAPVLLGSVLWEQKPLKLFAINAGYWLVSLSLMAVVIIA